MKFIKETTWQNVFEGWRRREEKNPEWINVATTVKGWPDWEAWRLFTASQINAHERKWQIFEFTDPINEIPDMLLGPYSGWQSRVKEKNRTTFKELLETDGQYEKLRDYKPIISVLNGIPFSTEFIGLLRKDNGKIVCIEGHHRATAFAIAQKEGKQIDFKKIPVLIALAEIPKDECGIFDEMTKRGTSRIQKS